VTHPVEPTEISGPQGSVRINTGIGDIPRRCPACGQDDSHPRHAIAGVRTERQMATLPDGLRVPVDRPVDEAYHHDCHAAMGCVICQELCDANGGTTRGKNADTITAPDHHVDIIPGEYTHDERGVYSRRLDKDAAAAELRAAHLDAGYDYVDHEEARRLHAAHAAGELDTNTAPEA
jgi:hypothetical protein